MKRALAMALVAWALAVFCVLLARAEGYMGDANAEFAAALAEREAARHRIDSCSITYYCCERRPHICNAGPPYRTASGKTPRVGMCAADDIPLGSTVMVDWDDDGVIDEWLVCEDRFGGHRKNAIDIVVPTHTEALRLGRKTAVVYWTNYMVPKGDDK